MGLNKDFLNNSKKINRVKKIYFINFVPWIYEIN